MTHPDDGIASVANAELLLRSQLESLLRRQALPNGYVDTPRSNEVLPILFDDLVQKSPATQSFCPIDFRLSSRRLAVGRSLQKSLGVLEQTHKNGSG